MAKGYNRPSGGRSGGGMMQQLKMMQDQLQTIQAQLAEETVEAAVGGGVVKVTMTGDQRCTNVMIDPEVLADADAEMLQDMILSAINLSLEKSRELASERMGPLAGGIPGLGI